MEVLILAALEAASLQGSQTLLISAISAIIAGVGVKLLDWFIGRDSIRVDEATQIRNELRSDTKRLTETTAELTRERDELHERYYELLARNQQLQLEVDLLHARLQGQDG